MAIFDKAKAAVRVSEATTAFDEEIRDIVAAAEADLREVGIVVPDNYEGGDALIDRAIILYTKANFGFIDEDGKFQRAYDYLKCALSLAGDYIDDE